MAAGGGLKPIGREALGRALEKAERYRLLNEPFSAESICLDILALEPNHQGALVLYVLALADQLRGGDGGVLMRARTAVERLTGEYERRYYFGIVAERRAVAFLESHAMGAREAAWDALREAMADYEAALAVRPAGNDDALLRYNTCVRLVEAHKLGPPSQAPPAYPLE